MAGARLARNERSAGARRSMASTMPGDPDSSARAWLSDRPSWCVDLGPTLHAMSTCDLWLALAKGDLAPDTRVWREGMAYWEPIARVPEFALALPDVSVWSSAPGGVAARAPVRGFEIEDAPGAPAAPEALDAHDEAGAGEERAEPIATIPSAVGVVTLAPPGDVPTSTPAPVVVEESEAPPASGARPRWLPRFDRRGAASVVAGAVIAIAALALATTGTARDGEPPGAGAQPAAAPALAEVRLDTPVRIGTAPPAGDPAAEDARTARDASGTGPVPARGGAGTAPMPPARAPWPGEGATPNTPVHWTAPGAGSAPGAANSQLRERAGEGGARATAAWPGRYRAPRGPHATDRGQRRARGGAR